MVLVIRILFFLMPLLLPETIPNRKSSSNSFGYVFAYSNITVVQGHIGKRKFALINGNRYEITTDEIIHLSSEGLHSSIVVKTIPHSDLTRYPERERYADYASSRSRVDEKVFMARAFGKKFRARQDLLLLPSAADSLENEKEKEEDRSVNCTRSIHDRKGIRESVELLMQEKAARSTNISSSRIDIESLRRENSERILIQILYTDGFNTTRKHNRFRFLKCALEKLKDNLMADHGGKTPMDVVVWLPKGDMASKTNLELGNIYWMPIPSGSWKLPCGLADDSLWVGRWFYQLDYYLMGRFRLTFAMDFASAAGYPFTVQLDDDAFVVSPLQYNMLDRFINSSIKMAVVSSESEEGIEFVDGLAELTRYWLRIRRYDPIGPLYDHVKPNDISGLTTATWDRRYHQAYFLAIDVKFWFKAPVQDYLRTIYRSGRDIEGRWQEQAVMNMVRLLFIPTVQFLLISDLRVVHSRSHSNVHCGFSKI